MGDVLTVEMTYKMEGADTFLFKSKGHKDEGQKLMLVKPVYKGDISEGLAMMHVGDSAQFFVNADSFYMRNVGMEKTPAFVKPNSKIVFDIKLMAVQKKADFDKEQKEKREKMQAMMEERKANEPNDIKKYLSDNRINVQPTKSGLYYIETLRGAGVKAADGKTVQVKYTGKLLDGTIFDSSDGKAPISFKLGSKQVIPGWEEGISMMRVGGKAKLVIPSSLAYGPNGAGQTILPFSPLVFDVELVDVK
jgi:FKBP-type peptidyl-prolyl cis-trans isomerase